MLEIQRVSRVLGGTFVDRMTDRKFAVLHIGSEAFTRHQLVTQVGTGNFRAARILHELCITLKIKSLSELYKYSPFELSAMHGLGTTTIFVLMSLFEAKGLDAVKWCGLKAKDAHVVSFTAMQHKSRRKDRAAEKEAKSQERKRKRLGLKKQANEILAAGGAA